MTMDNLAKTEEGIKEICYNNERKSILLIGDSIRQGYCSIVKNNLSTLYDVLYPNDNCRNTQYVLTSLLGWCKEIRHVNNIELVCFNCGHWDVAHWNNSKDSLTTREEYARNIRLIIKQLRVFFSKAKIVFLTTSPVLENTIGKMVNPRNNKEIQDYNKIANTICQEENIFVEDMYAFMESFDAKYYSDYVHLTDEGNEILGRYVADIIKNLLNN